MSDYIIRPIGIVKSTADKEVLKYSNKDVKIDFDVASKQGTDLKKSEIIINKEYVECLDGIEDFSHIVILFWTHKVPNNARQLKNVHPAGLKEIPLKGIFATRSPVRPNPICKTTVRLIERKGARLIVDGLDAIDNTPVVDIKPHIPFYDSPLNVKLANWWFHLMQKLKDLTTPLEVNGSSNPYSIDIRSHPCISPDQQRSEQ
ncbi:MAG: tRNA (N6-threonylcarbamoyladenosine(37)-N6)-methyltransferase TrmO [Candidatus Odinarchaeota archaeon]